MVATAEQAQAHGLDVLEDLRGRFEDDPAAIHDWAKAELWDQCPQEILVGLPPVRTVEVEGVAWTELLRDRDRVTDSSNRDTYTVDVTAQVGDEGEARVAYVRLSDAYPQDGWGPPSTLSH